MADLTEQWSEWARGGPHPARRRLAIQTYYALRLDYGKWVSYERAVQAMQFTAVGPDRASSLFTDGGVTELLKANNFDPVAVRKAATS